MHRMVSFPRRKGKFIEYRLVDGKKTTVATISASEWKQTTPPGKEEFEDDLEEGAYFRLVKVYKRGDKEEWEPVWTVGGYKKRQKGAADIRTTLNQVTEPLVAFSEGVTTIGEAVNKMYLAFHGVAAEQDGQPAEQGEGPPMTELQALKARLHEYNDLKGEVFSIMGYDPSHPQYPSLNYNGAAPWYLHPEMLRFSREFINGVLSDGATAAQEFGYKFRQGMSGVPPTKQGQPAQPAQQPQPDPTLFEENDKELEERLKKIQERKREPVTEQKEEPPMEATAN